MPAICTCERVKLHAPAEEPACALGEASSFEVVQVLRGRVLVFSVCDNSKGMTEEGHVEGTKHWSAQPQISLAYPVFETDWFNYRLVPRLDSHLPQP